MPRIPAAVFKSMNCAAITNYEWVGRFISTILLTFVVGGICNMIAFAATHVYLGLIAFAAIHVYMGLIAFAATHVYMGLIAFAATHVYMGLIAFAATHVYLGLIAFAATHVYMELPALHSASQGHTFFSVVGAVGGQGEVICSFQRGHSDLRNEERRTHMLWKRMTRWLRGVAHDSRGLSIYRMCTWLPCICFYSTPGDFSWSLCLRTLPVACQQLRICSL